MRCVSSQDSQNSLLTSVVMTLSKVYNQHQHSCFLYLGSVLVKFCLKILLVAVTEVTVIIS